MATASPCPASRLKARMLTITTTSRNSVPQRWCAVGYWRTFSGVSGSPCSSAWIDMCSAPWYWKTRLISPDRLISSR